jgi:photosystem II stability/assembly factor-like uncharacterized protein
MFKLNRKIFPLLISLQVLISFQTVNGQEIQMLAGGRPVSLRGLSVVDDQTIWVSGSEGTVGRSVDGGKTWTWSKVPGHEHADFRDVEAFSDLEAVIMGVAEPALIMRTSDGGNHWTNVYTDTAKSAFWDAMEFSGDQGALVGDPNKGNIFFVLTTDRGMTWHPAPGRSMPQAFPGEAFFAASGSNICYKGSGNWALVSGGKKSSIYYGGNKFALNLNQGSETTGANSIAVDPADSNQAFVVGGDFSQDTARKGNSLRIRFSPFSQESPTAPPRGYRSCVIYLDANRMVCCGSSGVDISKNGGMDWKGISEKSFHVCHKAKSGKAVFLAGTKGSIARLDWD